MKVLFVSLLFVFSSSAVALVGMEIVLLKDIEMKPTRSLGEDIFYNKNHLVSVKKPGVLSTEERGASKCNISLRSNSLHEKVFPKESRFTVTKAVESYPSVGDFMMASSGYLIETESNDFPNDVKLSIHCFSNRILYVTRFKYKKVKKTLKGLFSFEK